MANNNFGIIEANNPINTKDNNSIYANTNNYNEILNAKTFSRLEFMAKLAQFDYW